MSIQPDDPNVDKFCTYLIDTYIGNDALFPSEIWAGLSTDFFKATTNACESFTSKLSHEFYHSHPSLFDFVNVLLELQLNTYIKIRSCDTIRDRSTQTICKYALIKEEFLKFKNDANYRFTYVKIASTFNKHRKHSQKK